MWENIIFDIHVAVPDDNGRSRIHLKIAILVEIRRKGGRGDCYSAFSTDFTAFQGVSDRVFLWSSALEGPNCTDKVDIVQ